MRGPTGPSLSPRPGPTVPRRPSFGRPPERVLLQIKGLVLLLVLALLVALAIAVYDKRFVSSVDVVVRSDRAGLQLPANGDVRMRGTIIGRVTSVRSEGDGVAIALALDPDDARLVPADARARVLPTTLFGQKYVELVDPDQATPTDHVRGGAVLLEDTSREAVEVTEVLDHLVPVLQAVQPQELSATLQALAEGLEGRGEQLGRTAVTARRYLNAINQDLPQLAVDLRLFAVVSRSYAAATPAILDTLANATVTGTTILDNRTSLDAFYREVTRFARTTARYLDQNGDGIVHLNRVTRPVLQLLGTYSPEFPCLFKGLLRAETVAGEAFRDGAFHADVVLGKQYPGYTAEDLPEFGDLGRGPHCAGLPNVRPPVPATHSNDGADNPRGSAVARVRRYSQ